ncbi:GyrI-like domain-containing protein [Winogradskyella flava]|uniref:GyrI-like domain-containing protein n=1 Tax=Winogradskyella flava TaxID=1884876 RepID=UPI0024911232|nr:GyrI-like domain-containing protein [Winogradskyella flava]
MSPKIITIKEKKLIGMKRQMLQHQYQKIPALWKQFMPRKEEIRNTINNEFIAVQEYSDFGNFGAPFDIWACIEAYEISHIPNGFEILTIPESLYAVFLQKGMDASGTYQRIMTEWLPNSGYAIDNRPHFQVMGAKYKNGSPDSEEDFYVPIRTLE